jgi:hypothetical protein
MSIRAFLCIHVDERDPFPFIHRCHLDVVPARGDAFKVPLWDEPLVVRHVTLSHAGVQMVHFCSPYPYELMRESNIWGRPTEPMPLMHLV